MYAMHTMHVISFRWPTLKLTIVSDYIEHVHRHVEPQKYAENDLLNDT